MATRITLVFALCAGLSVSAMAQTITTDTKDYQTARKRLYLGTDTFAYFTVIRQVISIASAHKHVPTAKAVYDYLETFRTVADVSATPNAAKIKINNTNSTGVTLVGTDGLKAEAITSGQVDLSLRDNSVNVGKLAASGATTGQFLKWSGTAWIPSAGSGGYVYVTANSSITAAVNTVLIPTLSASITLGLPTCDATNDGKQFLFQKSGTDISFGLTIDPSGSEQFSDGATTKTIFSTSEFTCTCRFASGTGAWFYNF